MRDRQLRIATAPASGSPRTTQWLFAAACSPGSTFDRLNAATFRRRIGRLFRNLFSRNRKVAEVSKPRGSHFGKTDIDPFSSPLLPASRFIERICRTAPWMAFVSPAWAKQTHPVGKSLCLPALPAICTNEASVKTRSSAPSTMTSMSLKVTPRSNMVVVIKKSYSSARILFTFSSRSGSLAETQVNCLSGKSSLNHPSSSSISWICGKKSRKRRFVWSCLRIRVRNRAVFFLLMALRQFPTHRHSGSGNAKP